MNMAQQTGPKEQERRGPERPPGFPPVEDPRQGPPIEDPRQGPPLEDPPPDEPPEVDPPPPREPGEPPKEIRDPPPGPAIRVAPAGVEGMSVETGPRGHQGPYLRTHTSLLRFGATVSVPITTTPPSWVKATSAAVSAPPFMPATTSVQTSAPLGS